MIPLHPLKVGKARVEQLLFGGVSGICEAHRPYASTIVGVAHARLRSMIGLTHACLPEVLVTGNITDEYKQHLERQFLESVIEELLATKGTHHAWHSP
jgi:hypothetical protein